MARHAQGQLEFEPVPGPLDIAFDQGAVALGDAMLAERTAQPIPLGILGGYENHSGCLDIQAVNHSTAEPALPHPMHFGTKGRDVAEQGALFPLLERVHRHARGLGQGQPTRAFGEHRGRGLRFPGLGDPLVRRSHEGLHPQLALGLERAALVAGRQGPAIQGHRAPLQQAPRLTAGEVEFGGEKEIQAHALRPGAEDQEASAGTALPGLRFGLFHGSSVGVGRLSDPGPPQCSGAISTGDPRLGYPRSARFRPQWGPTRDPWTHSRPPAPPRVAAALNRRAGHAEKTRASSRKKTEMNTQTSAQPHIAVMDTTLRDGEQTPDVSYTPAEKLQLARMLLLDAEVDRIEIASTRVSEGEREAARAITAWARKNRVIGRVEILGFCDGKASVDWIAEVGGKVLNLLAKGSEKHCRGQLGLTPEEHRNRVEQTVRYARRRRMTVNVYLEDWSSGVRDSFDYVFSLVQLLRELRVARIYLPDTLGIFSPGDVSRYVGLMTQTWPQVDFEFHGHNDYGLATANCLAAAEAGARGVHTSVNAMGERAGNSSLTEVVTALHDHSDLRTDINESRLTALSRMVETFSGKDVAANTPITGRDVFTQTAGVHADGDAKGDLYHSRLEHGRFGRARRYALGKLSGKASLDHNLQRLGIELPASDREVVLRRIIELGDKKHVVSPEDLPYIIADVLKAPAEQMLRVHHYRVVVAEGEAPAAEVSLAYEGNLEKAEASGDGGYDAFMNALKKAVRAFDLEIPKLTDFKVRIPPGGRTGALVETQVTWQLGEAKKGAQGETFTTLGVDSDQMAAAVIATEKMLNRVAGKRKTSRPAKGRPSRRRPRKPAR